MLVLPRRTPAGITSSEATDGGHEARLPCLARARGVVRLVVGVGAADAAVAGSRVGPAVAAHGVAPIQLRAAARLGAEPVVLRALRRPGCGRRVEIPACRGLRCPCG